MTTNKQQARADKDWNIFMTLCIAGMFLMHLAASIIDSAIIA